MKISDMNEAQKNKRLEELKKLIEKGILLDNFDKAVEYYQITRGYSEKKAKEYVKDLLAIDKEAIM